MVKPTGQRGKRLRTRTLTTVAVLITLAITGFSSSASAATSETEVSLTGTPPLATVPCTIDVIAGQTYTGFNLDDCVTGGQGARTFGPSPAPGDNPAIDPGGTYTYTAPNDAETTSFPFTVEDQNGATASGAVIVIVHKAAEPIELRHCSVVTGPGQTIQGDLHDCISGGDGDPSFGPPGTHTTPGGGTVTINPDGTYTYTVPNTPNSNDTIDFTVTDTTVSEPLHGAVDVTITSGVNSLPTTGVAQPGGGDPISTVLFLLSLTVGLFLAARMIQPRGN